MATSTATEKNTSKYLTNKTIDFYGNQIVYHIPNTNKSVIAKKSLLSKTGVLSLYTSEDEDGRRIGFYFPHSRSLSLGRESKYGYFIQVHRDTSSISPAIKEDSFCFSMGLLLGIRNLKLISIRYRKKTYTTTLQYLCYNGIYIDNIFDEFPLRRRDELIHKYIIIPKRLMGLKSAQVWEMGKIHRTKHKIETIFDALRHGFKFDIFERFLENFKEKDEKILLKQSRKEAAEEHAKNKRIQANQARRAKNGE